MAVKIAKFTTWQPEEIELHDGKVYPCRQISAAGLDLLQRIREFNAGADVEQVERSELVDEVASLLSAPIAEVKRCSVDELLSVLISASVPAEKMREALSEDAEKNAPRGAARPTPRKKATR